MINQAGAAAQEERIQKAELTQPTTGSVLGSTTILSDIYTLTGLAVSFLFHPISTTQIHLSGMWPFSGGVSFDPAKDIKSLDGKVILVTGANAGLGQETILQIAKHNPTKIYLAARTESKALEAIRQINNALAGAKAPDIEYLALDLSSLKSVKAAADKVTSSTSRLDTLILNAGIMATPDGRTSSGHEIQLGTNHIGHFLLTKSLLPILLKIASQPNSDVRVISVSSEAFNMAPSIDVITSTEKLAAMGTWTRYGASKAANILFAAELARRYPAIKAVSLHPGLIMTNLYTPNRDSNFLVRYGTAIVAPWFFKTVPQGALNQIWAAVGAKREELKDGAYYTPVGVLQDNKWANDKDGGKQLWEWTEQELSKAGF